MLSAFATSTLFLVSYLTYHDQDQRDNGSGQYCVGDQDREVERANPTSTFKRDRADLVVIGEIRDQKKS